MWSLTLFAQNEPPRNSAIQVLLDYRIEGWEVLVKKLDCVWLPPPVGTAARSPDLAEDADEAVVHVPRAPPLLAVRLQDAHVRAVPVPLEPAHEPLGRDEGLGLLLVVRVALGELHDVREIAAVERGSPSQALLDDVRVVLHVPREVQGRVPGREALQKRYRNIPHERGETARIPCKTPRLQDQSPRRLISFRSLKAGGPGGRYPGPRPSDGERVRSGSAGCGPLG